LQCILLLFLLLLLYSFYARGMACGYPAAAEGPDNRRTPRAFRNNLSTYCTLYPLQKQRKKYNSYRFIEQFMRPSFASRRADTCVAAPPPRICKSATVHYRLPFKFVVIGSKNVRLPVVFLRFERERKFTNKLQFMH
jgi:hypothetical protein